MPFKYLNPGYAELLDVAGGTTVNDARKSRTGMSCWQPTENYGIGLAETPAELYGKFDVWLHHEGNGNEHDVEIRVCMDGINGVGIRKYGSTWYVYGYCNGHAQVSRSGSPADPAAMKASTGLVLDTVNTVYFRSKPRDDDTAGNLSLWINDMQIADYDYAISFGTSKVIEVVSTSANGLLSSLILSDTGIHKREQVVILPISATETTMTADGSGGYTANAAGQQILQSIDTASLVADYGADSRICGIAVIGNPAYRTAEGLAYLTALEKKGDTITEYGTKETAACRTAGVIDSRAISLSLADLANCKFGWKAGVGS